MNRFHGSESYDELLLDHRQVEFRGISAHSLQAIVPEHSKAHCSQL